MYPDLDFTVIITSRDVLLSGLMNTVALCFIASVLGMVLAVPLALCNLAVSPWARTIAKAFIAVVRDTPFLVQVFIIYFVLPSMGIRLSNYAAGVLALTLYATAHFSEVIRGAILSVPRGQADAARACGMSYGVTLRRIIFPQMLGYLLPPLGNQLAGLIKESSILSIVAVPELTMAFQNVLGLSFAVPETFIAVSILYWILITSVTFGCSQLERIATLNGRDTYLLKDR